MASDRQHTHPPVRCRRAGPRPAAAGRQSPVPTHRCVRVCRHPPGGPGGRFRNGLREGGIMTSALKVLDAGPYTTFQDMGRTGYQDVGVPVSGALDKVSARLANVLVGNPPGTTVLEMLLQGMSFEVQAGAVRAVLFGCDGRLEVAG